MSQYLRNIPAVHELQKSEQFHTLLQNEKIDKSRLTHIVTDVISQIRSDVLEEKLDLARWEASDFVKAIFSRVEDKITQMKQTNLEKVINGSGVVLHTNLGRARLSEAATKQLQQIASSYSTIEYNVQAGKRGSRHDIVESYLQKLTGAEAAMVVNNNAAAVYFVLKAFAQAKEVIVSRGELVEIGGSFRISEIMKESESKLVEVGTTNKTHLKDYEAALTEETALLLKVHKSNFHMFGFTEEVSSRKLVELGKAHEIPVYEDLGSGTLYPFKQVGIGKEPTVKEQVQSGVDLLSFSGDKLLGGPQAGIIVGKKAYIDQLKQHQLARVLRVDKFTLASLEATLQAYVNGREEEIPTVRDIVAKADDIYERAEACYHAVKRLKSFTCTLEEDMSKVGGGTMPEVNLPTYVLQISHKVKKVEELEEALRKWDTPIICRLRDDRLLIDFRTVQEEEIKEIVKALEVIGSE